MNQSFTFSDSVAGYVRSYDKKSGEFVMQTSDGKDVALKLGSNVFAELVRNLGEPFHDATSAIGTMLTPGRFLHVYGIYFPDTNVMDAKHLVFHGRDTNEFQFENPGWWTKQIDELGRFYRVAEFGSDAPDFRNYVTNLDADGHHATDTRQETDTISRLIYGFSSAYLLTGNEDYLAVAENGCDYLLTNMRSVDRSRGICYWYHALDFKGGRERKILASEFGDDLNAIPCYEQIYALAGPIQTFRINGDPELLESAELTINLFNKFFLDKSEAGGYFSHIDPVTFSPTSESLGHNRARKNWNSVGDHAPAYLINLYLATGEKRYADMLEYTFDTVAKRFPDYQNSPFVQEKFFADWSKDQTWGWQQNRAVVGHNLKIAWNLMRMQSLKSKDSYVDLAKKIGEIIPTVGMDSRRGGWYDVMERTVAPGEQLNRFAWHDRKAWWQQEQGILAYLILHGVVGDDRYLKLARESSAFYNAWFLDHDSGGVYFNVLANGLPYMLGTERTKGSHSMAGYHSFELCYLATVYTNLLITRQPLDLYFSPLPTGTPNRILRVAPDLLPAGSCSIASVKIDGRPHQKFDASNLTVTLPDSTERLKVQVTLKPR